MSPLEALDHARYLFGPDTFVQEETTYSRGDTWQVRRAFWVFAGGTGSGILGNSDDSWIAAIADAARKESELAGVANV